MYVCRETGVCLERLECFGRRVACAYVYEEREMCLWQERKSCMGVFAMTSVFSWENSFSLCPASFCTPRPNFPVTPAVS